MESIEQTATEWLLQQMDLETISKYDKQLVKAKEMEKEQIIDTFQDSRILSITNNCSSGEQYYNETFKSE
jgi:hypothetical protein